MQVFIRCSSEHISPRGTLCGHAGGLGPSSHACFTDNQELDCAQVQVARSHTQSQRHSGLLPKAHRACHGSAHGDPRLGSTLGHCGTILPAQLASAGMAVTRAAPASCSGSGAASCPVGGAAAAFIIAPAGRVGAGRIAPGVAASDGCGAAPGFVLVAERPGSVADSQAGPWQGPCCELAQAPSSPVPYSTIAPHRSSPRLNPDES